MTRHGFDDLEGTVSVRTARRAHSVFDDTGRSRSYGPSTTSRFSMEPAKAQSGEEFEDSRFKSRKQDRALLDSISNKLNKLEFDNIKPGSDVSLKTGFRRHIYHRKRPPLEKETREKMRKDNLLYPWNFTKENLYRSNRRGKKSVKERTAEQINDEDAYPAYDPMGLYRPRPKKPELKHDPFEIEEKYKTMNVREIMANMRAKSYVKPSGREPSVDVDKIISELSRPLPKSEVADYVPYTGNLYDEVVLTEDERKPDPMIARKFAQGRGELEEFDRMLDERFGRRRAAPRVQPVVVQRPAAVQWDADWSDDDYDDVGVRGNVVPVNGYYEQEFGDDDDYSDVGLPPRSPVRPYTSTRQVSSRKQAGGMYGRAGLPMSTNRVRSIQTHTDYSEEPEPYIRQPVSYTTLRSRTADARDKMDQTRTLLDRCLPLPMGPSPEVQHEVNIKFDELAERYAK